MAGRSQRHMEELADIYTKNSSDEAAPTLTTDITSKSTTTTVNVATAGNFAGEASFSASRLPENCTINASTGVITGTSSAGSYTNVQIFAENPQGVAKTSKFTWTVT